MRQVRNIPSLHWWALSFSLEPKQAPDEAHEGAKVKAQELGREIRSSLEAAEQEARSGFERQARGRESETEKRDREVAREQAARDYLRREAERVLKEREGKPKTETLTMGAGVEIYLRSPIRELVEKGDVVMVGLIIYDLKRDELRCLPPDKGIAKDCWRDILLKFFAPKISASPE